MTQAQLQKDEAPTPSKDGIPQQPQVLIRYRGVVYNAAGFVPSHPGGPDVFEHLKDITSAYDKIGHSEKAHRIMGRLPVVQGVSSDLFEDSQHKSDGAKKVTLEGKFLVKKLFTEEDKNNVHKTLGFLSLASFAYRYFYVLPTTGRLGFGTNFYLDSGTLLVHLLLSYSSLIFHVLEKRIIKHPLIIYEEYRLHAILFTTRAIGVSVVGLYQHLLPDRLRSAVLVSFLVLISLAVDYVTKKYGTPGVTAVRNDDDGTFKGLRLFYASYQFLALGSHIRVDPLLMDLGWNAVIAIQSSSFLMTLKRKSLIRWYTHAFWYTLALALSLIYMYIAKGPVWVLSIVPVYLLRVSFNMDKYLLWAVYLAVVNTPNFILPESVRALI